jgi:small-conductance mechanosensitive channel
MARLLASEPLHTDGALTKENRAREAKVSHATVHRAEEVLAEWDANVARPVLRTPGEVARDKTIDELRKQLRKAKSQVKEVQGKLDALATVTANLYAENQALRKRVDGRDWRVFLPARDRGASPARGWLQVNTVESRARVSATTRS